ncbi:MAG: hypothetical protein ABWZ80_10580 [Beijerinckiaceae bacterium]
MWSVLSEVEPPWLRVVAFLALVPLMWVALLACFVANAAVAPILVRAKRRRDRA